MSNIRRKIPCISCLTEVILVIWKIIFIKFGMFHELGVKQSFENLSNSWSESNRAIVGAVTHFRKDTFRDSEWGQKSTNDRCQLIRKLLQKEWSTRQTKFMSRDNDGGHRDSERQTVRIRSIRITEEDLAEEWESKRLVLSTGEQAIEASKQISGGKVELQKSFRIFLDKDQKHFSVGD